MRSKLYVLAIALLFMVSGCRMYSGFTQVVSAKNAAHPFGQGSYFLLTADDGSRSYLRKVDASTYAYSSDPRKLNTSIPVLKSQANTIGSTGFSLVRYARVNSSGVLGNYRKYIVEMASPSGPENFDPETLSEAKRNGFDGVHTYIYYLITIDDAGVVRWLSDDDDDNGGKQELPVKSLTDVRSRFIADMQRMLRTYGKVGLEQPGTYSAITKSDFEREVSAYQREVDAKAAEKRRKEQQERQAEAARKQKEEEQRNAEAKRKIAEARAREAAKKAYDNRDREPTEAEMKAAMGRTVAGSIFPVSHVQKLGGCRKMADYDYVCRYRYIGVNWGNFWKVGDTWYFQIVD